MRTVLARLLAAVPFDERGRRAVDEALADWAWEAADARTLPRRIYVSMQSLVAVTRALVRTIVDEVVRIPGGWLTSRLLLLLAAPALALAATGWGHVPVRGVVTLEYRLQLLGLALPPAATALLPLALFAAVVFRRRDRALPTLGLAAVAFVCVLAIGLWILPSSSRRFHETAYVLQTKGAPIQTAGRLPAGAPDLPPLELIATAVARPWGPPMAVVLFRAGLPFLAVAFVVLGSAVRRLDGNRRRACVALVSASYAGGIAVLPSDWEFGGHATAPVGLVPWVAAGLAIALSMTIGHQQTEGELR